MKILKAESILEHKLTIYESNNSDDFLISANEIANIIDNKNVSQMLKNVDEEEKYLEEIITENNKIIRKWFLTEDGLYEVLMLSKKPIAKEFKKRVKQLLKQIRLNGGYIYIKAKDNEKLINDRINQVLGNIKEELNEKNQKLIEYNNFFIEDKELVSLNFLAEKYELKQEELFKKLNRAKFIYKKGNNIYLYREHKYKRYIKYYKVKDKHIIKFTSKGQLIIDEILNKGISYE